MATATAKMSDTGPIAMETGVSVLSAPLARSFLVLTGRFQLRSLEEFSKFETKMQPLRIRIPTDLQVCGQNTINTHHFPLHVPQIVPYPPQNPPTPSSKIQTSISPPPTPLNRNRPSPSPPPPNPKTYTKT